LQNASIVVSLVNSFVRHQPQYDQDYQFMWQLKLLQENIANLERSINKIANPNQLEMLGSLCTGHLSMVGQKDRFRHSNALASGSA